MATHQILTPEKLKEFNTPSQYRSKDYDALFDLSPDAEAYFKRQNRLESKLAFLMQYSYCKAESQFFDPKLYPVEVIRAAIERYQPLTRLRTRLSARQYPVLTEDLVGHGYRHKQKVLSLLSKKEVEEGGARWRELDGLAKYQAEKQTGPELLFDTLVSACRERNYLVPEANQLMALISGHYHQYKAILLKKVNDLMDSDEHAYFHQLIEVDSSGAYPLTRLKTIEQKIKPRAFIRNAQRVKEVRAWHSRYATVLSNLELNDQAIAYYSEKVLNADIYQLRQLKIDDISLHLLCFIADNHQRRQDAMLLSFLKKWSSERRKANEKAKEQFFRKQSQEMQLIAKSAQVTRSHLEALRDIASIVEDESLHPEEKIRRIHAQVADVLAQEDTDNIFKRADMMESLVATVGTDIPRFRELLADSQSLIRQFKPVVLSLEFDPVNECPKFFDALMAFQAGEALTGTFIEGKDSKILRELGSSDGLLTLLFFDTLARHIRSGKLSLLHSFHFKRLGCYEIDETVWRVERNAIMASTNLLRFKSFKKLKAEYCRRLDAAYSDINAFLDEPECTQIYTRNGRGFLREPKKGPQEYIQALSTLLYDVRGTMVTDVLREISEVVPFHLELSHSTNQYAKRSIDLNQLLAAILSEGLNLGARKMFDSSKGLSETTLLDTVRFRLTAENLKRANDRLLAVIDDMPLSREFQKARDVLRSSSDGQKYLVTRDSLVAANSFKYFGQESGVSRYTYVDEKNRTFSIRVFMPTKREATYVLDGLASNISNIPRIHSTDTHGFTEPIFACTALMGVRFAPRIKDIKDQRIYGNHSPHWYQKQGYAIRPSREIKWQLIESQWDEILRFMASFLSGKCLASQLFNRLNSYAGDHPLYKALKELGRVEKTLFILRYYRNKELREDIQKQLNLGEQMNKFSKAVTWGDGQRLRGQTTEEFERAAACTQLIQNVIILWNYLYATERLAAIADQAEREELKRRLSQGQMIAWAHVNLTGTFIFTRRKENAQRFNLSVLQDVDLGEPVYADDVWDGPY